MIYILYNNEVNIRCPLTNQSTKLSTFKSYCSPRKTLPKHHFIWRTRRRRGRRRRRRRGRRRRRRRRRRGRRRRRRRRRRKRRRRGRRLL